MNCDHEKIGVMPGTIERKDDGVAVKLEGGEVRCLSCEEDLPFEDLYLYDTKDVSVMIPTEYVDGEDV